MGLSIVLAHHEGPVSVSWNNVLLTHIKKVGTYVSYCTRNVLKLRCPWCWGLAEARRAVGRAWPAWGLHL